MANEIKAAFNERGNTAGSFIKLPRQRANFSPGDNCAQTPGRAGADQIISKETNRQIAHLYGNLYFLFNLIEFYFIY